MRGVRVWVDRVVLRKHACDAKGWVNYCKIIKTEKWVRRDNDGEVRRRRSPRHTRRSDARALTRETLGRQLVGRPLTRRPAPDDVSAGEVHVYTDRTVSIRGRWSADNEVWFGEQSNFNIL